MSTNHPEKAASRRAVDEIEEHVLRLLDELAADAVLDVDKRWLATGRTDIEKGFASIVRSIEKPARADIADPEAEARFARRFRRVVGEVPGEAWAIEIERPAPARPLFYAPKADGHAVHWSEHRDDALRLTRAADAVRLACALGVQACAVKIDGA